MTRHPRKSKIIAGLKDMVRHSRGEKLPGSRTHFVPKTAVVFRYDRSKRLTPKQIAAERKQLIRDIRRSIATSAELAARLEQYSDAIRLSGIALLSAACFADEHGDRKAGMFYEKRGYANLELIGREPPFRKKRGLARSKRV